MINKCDLLHICQATTNLTQFFSLTYFQPGTSSCRTFIPSDFLALYRFKKEAFSQSPSTVSVDGAVVGERWKERAAAAAAHYTVLHINF